MLYGMRTDDTHCNPMNIQVLRASQLCRGFHYAAWAQQRPILLEKLAMIMPQGPLSITSIMYDTMILLILVQGDKKRKVMKVESLQMTDACVNR